MKTRHIVHQSNGKDIVALKENGVIIHSAQEFLDIVMNLPSDRVIPTSVPTRGEGARPIPAPNG